jgi:lipid II:glycine glycyltransferase (peptidoglycan interpeptide bridge formation enzyme)
MESNIIKVESLRNTEDWDCILEQFQGSIYQSVDFLFSLKSDVIKPVFLKFFKEGKVIAMLSGIEVFMENSYEKQLFFYAGLATHEKANEILKACKDTLVNFATAFGYSRMVFRSYDDTSYQFVNADKYYMSKVREECIIDLSKGEKELEKGFTKNVRRHVKKAKTAGVIFKKGNSPDHLNRLVELMNTTQKVRKGKGYGSYTIFALPFIDKNVMLKLLQSNAATLYYAEYDGEIVSMQFTLKAMRRAYGIFMGTSSSGYELAAPSVLFHDIAFDLKEKGFYSYNLGGVTIGSKHDGVRKFKLTMGSELFRSSEEKTYFLQPDLKKYNILLRFKHFVSHIRIPGRLKKQVLRFANLLMRRRDSL